MHNLSVQRGGVNPSVAASIDTHVLYFDKKNLPKGIRTRVEAVHGRRIIIEPCIGSPASYVWGYRVIVHQPSIATINLLDDFRVKHGGTMSRVDIAFDFPLEMLSWLEAHAIMQWRRQGSMHEEENGYYFVQHGDRDILLYWDRVSKILREVVAHFELRFKSARMIRAQGWSSGSDLIDINPMELFAKHVRLVDIDFNVVGQRIEQVISSNPSLSNRLRWAFKRGYPCQIG